MMWVMIWRFLWLEAQIAGSKCIDSTSWLSNEIPELAFGWALGPTGISNSR